MTLESAETDPSVDVVLTYESEEVLESSTLIGSEDVVVVELPSLVLTVDSELVLVVLESVVFEGSS